MTSAVVRPILLQQHLSDGGDMVTIGSASPARRRHSSFERTFDRLLVDLEREQGVVAERIRRAIRQETPQYARFDNPGEEAAWAAGIDSCLAMFIRSARENRRITTEERSAMAVIGRRRADQDKMTLDAIDASIRVAVCVTLDFVLECMDVADIGDRETRDALRELSVRLTRFGNEITASALNAFLVRKEERATSRFQADVRLYDDVLGGRFDVAEVMGRAASQGIDLERPRAVVLVSAARAVAGARSLEAELVVALPDAVAVPMATASVPHSVVVFRAAESWNTLLDRVRAIGEVHRCTVLLVGPCRGPHELHRRYRSAKSLLPYLAQLAPGESVVDAADVAEMVLLTGVDVDTRHAYLEDLLGPIERDARSARLFRTLEAVTEHGTSLKAVSQHAGFNVKTVRNHIRAIEQLTGLCLDRPAHLQRLGIGMQLRRVVGSDRFSR